MLSRMMRAFGIALVATLGACATTSGTTTSSSSSSSREHPATETERAAAQPAIEKLTAGAFDDAQRLASEVVATQPANPRAHAALAVARYQLAATRLFEDTRTVVDGASRAGFNHRVMRAALEAALADLAAVDDSLGRAALDPTFSLELCLACWKIDWNHNGRIDARDERLLELESDADGNAIPDGDPRRRPTFRFDVADLHWARAMVAFQRALLEVVLAYRWEELDRLLLGSFFRREGERTITIRLGDRARVVSARALVLAGLEHAARSRKAILAESDDDREWVPSPRQKSHPLPLPVDDALFATWEGVLDDVRRLVRGDDGLPVGELAALLGMRFRDAAPPAGFVDLGRMFSDPRDITFDLDVLKRASREPEAALVSTLGSCYVPKMHATALVGRLQRMKGELDRGEETLAKKLRYLFWLN